MTTVAAMQPYFLPYIGYFRLITAVDQFILLDNVNYINGGWINRNRWLMQGRPHTFNIPLSHASQHKLINELMIDRDHYQPKKLLTTVYHCYHLAPEFAAIFPLLEKIFYVEKSQLLSFIIHALQVIFDYLERDFVYQLASLTLPKTCAGAEYIIALCQSRQATHYLNASGGRTLYDASQFSQAGIQLGFLPEESFQYPQFDHPFVANLSLIDVLMFNKKQRIITELGQQSVKPRL